MSDAMSCAELAAQHAELLPARTVLSILNQSTLNPGDIEITGPRGEPGTQGANGQSMRGFNFLGWFGWSGSDAVPSTAGTTSGNPA
ncbi:MAG: hypothetical protein ACRDRA_00660 [Pseudonocardiaceae bacterium]